METSAKDAPPEPTGTEPTGTDRERLLALWHGIESGEPFPHTSVVVPSLSFDQEELAKIEGASFYEERLLFSLMRLRHPQARVVYVTSQPIHPDIVDYYLQLLAGVPARHARERLKMLCCYDASPRPLTAKILERPRLIARIAQFLDAGPSGASRAYLTCFNVTSLERSLAERLRLPLNGVDPSLLWLGSKSGARETFREAGIALPLGYERLRGESDVVDALARLADARPGLRRAVIKLDESFAGAGNALFRYPEDLPPGGADDGRRRASLRAALEAVEFSDPSTVYSAYFRKLAEMGGIVEEFLEAAEVRSPSVQLRIRPDGEVILVSTHDQVLGGATGQTYVGCRFPAHAEYRGQIQDQARRIGEMLRDRGVISRFAVDFLVVRDGPDDAWAPAAIEINLRMGGTTPPFLALQFLTGGAIDEASGTYRTRGGVEKYYYATDHLHSARYRGLLPDDLLDIFTARGLGFDPTTETGVLFHMIGAISQYGRVGVTCIGDSREEADALYAKTVEVLDHASARDAWADREPLPRVTPME